MQFVWKPAWLLALVALTLVGGGCSGLNTTQGVSPATFLMPGFFGQMPPNPATTPGSLPAEASVQTIAQSN